MSHFSEAGGKSENEGQKVGVCVERSIEDLQRSLQEMKASGDFSKGSLSPGQVQRPHSPVAEFLDHLEFEPLERSQVILEKQVDALSDLESSKSSQELEAFDKENIPILLMPTTDNLLSDQQSSRSHYSAEQSDEEVDLNLQHEGIHLITSPGIPIISKYIYRHVLLTILMLLLYTCSITFNHVHAPVFNLSIRCRALSVLLANRQDKVKLKLSKGQTNNEDIQPQT